MKFKYRLLFFLIGIAGITIMVIQADPSQIDWADLLTSKIFILFAVLFGLWFIIYSVHAISYKIILGKDGKKVTFLQLMRICISGFALNNVTPAGLVGGEPYRIMELKRHTSTERATSSTLTFTLFYIAGHIALWLTGSILYFVMGLPGEAYVTVLMIATCVFCVLFLLAFFFSKKAGLVMPFMKFLSILPFLKKVAKKWIDKNHEQYIEIDDNIKAFRSQSGSFWSVLGLQYLSRLLEGLEYFFILKFFEPSAHLIDGLIVMSLASLIGNLLFLIPMQAGSREGGMTMALGFLGFEAGTGVMVGIIYRTREFLCLIFGICLILIERKDKKNAVKQVINGDIAKVTDGENISGESDMTDDTGGTESVENTENVDGTDDIKKE